MHEHVLIIQVHWHKLKQESQLFLSDITEGSGSNNFATGQGNAKSQAEQDFSTPNLFLKQELANVTDEQKQMEANVTHNGACTARPPLAESSSSVEVGTKGAEDFATSGGEQQRAGRTEVFEREFYTAVSNASKREMWSKSCTEQGVHLAGAPGVRGAGGSCPEDRQGSAMSGLSNSSCSSLLDDVRWGWASLS